MGLPFDAKRVHEYAVEFGAGGQRLGCKFRLADVSLLFAHESHITPEIEQLMASLANQRFEAWRIRRWGAKVRIKTPINCLLERSDSSSEPSALKGSGRPGKLLQPAARQVEGCVDGHDGVLVLRCDLQVLRARDCPHLRRRGDVLGGNAKVDPDLGDAAAPFVFRKLHLYPAAYQTTVELFELGQLPPDSEFNLFYGRSVMKLDL
jgi:hypothetical protein